MIQRKLVPKLFDDKKEALHIDSLSTLQWDKTCTNRALPIEIPCVKITLLYLLVNRYYLLDTTNVQTLTIVFYLIFLSKLEFLPVPRLWVPERQLSQMRTRICLLEV